MTYDAWKLANPWDEGFYRDSEEPDDGEVACSECGVWVLRDLVVDCSGVAPFAGKCCPVCAERLQSASDGDGRRTTT